MVSGLNKNVKKMVGVLVKSLSVRNKDVILRRFGLKSGKRETLESIGQSYGVTRERIRQIEEHALKGLRNTLTGTDITAQVRPYFDLTSSLLSEHGGLLSEEALFEKFSGIKKDSLDNLSFSLLLSLNKDFGRTYENDDFYTFWFLKSDAEDSSLDTINAVIASVKDKGSLLSKEEFYAVYKSKARRPVSLSAFLTLISASKNIASNIFGQCGLVSWPEIKPRGVRDRAYLVLKRESKPKHFREITSLINTAQFVSKRANVQTVHNELIKDSRFVLVGRGMYGLSEWGYRAGTVKDVLVDILKESKRPLPKSELVAKVLSSRYVKENTVLLNLQDSKTFSRKNDGTYFLREA